MEDVYKLTIQFEGEDKIYKVNDAIDELNQRIQTTETTIGSANGHFSDFLQAMKNDIANASSFITDAKEKIDEGGPNANSYARSVYSGNYEIGARSIEAIQSDLKRFDQVAKALSEFKLDEKDVSIVEKSIPKLRNLLRRVAGDISYNLDSHKELPSDENILQRVKANKEYSAIAREMSARFHSVNRGYDVSPMTNSTNFRNYMDKLLEFELLNSVDKTQRGSYMQAYRNLKFGGRTFTSYQDMLPGSFKNFAKRENREVVNDGQFIARMTGGNNAQLTSAEMKSIKELIRNNEFAAQAFEAMNIVQRKNGRLQINNLVTQQGVNGAAGVLAQVMENAARGAPRFGVRDVYDPDSWEKISNKTNARLVGSRQAARYLTDVMPWLDPAIFSEQQIKEISDNAFKEAKSANMVGRHSIGKIKFGARPNSYEAARYNVYELDRNINWENGYAPDELDSHGQSKRKFDIYGSLQLDSILRASRGRLPEHNSPINETFFVDIPEELYDPDTPQETREALEKKIGEIYLNGKTIRVNGQDQHYSAVRANVRSVGIQMVRDDLIKKVEEEHGGKEHGMHFLSAGLDINKITKPIHAAEFVEYLNKSATEGVDIRTLFGESGIHKKDGTYIHPDEIVITDMKDLTKGIRGAGVDGASFISSILTGGQTFQGRLTGMKSVLNSLNIARMVEAAGGDIPVADIKGDIRKITKATRLIVNKEDLKGLSISDFENMSYEDIQKEIARRYNNGELYVSKTSDQVANGGMEWIPSQLAQTMKLTKEQAMVFAKRSFDIISELGTVPGQIKHVFAGEEALQNELSRNPALLNKGEYRARVEAFRRNVFEKVGRGALPKLDGLETNNAFAAPWFFNLATDIVSGLSEQGKLDPN